MTTRIDLSAFERRQWRAAYTAGGGHLSWWTIEAESLALAVIAARQLSEQVPSLGTLYEVVQAEESEL